MDRCENCLLYSAAIVENGEMEAANFSAVQSAKEVCGETQKALGRAEDEGAKPESTPHRIKNRIRETNGRCKKGEAKLGYIPVTITRDVPKAYYILVARCAVENGIGLWNDATKACGLYESCVLHMGISHAVFRCPRLAESCVVVGWDTT